MSDTHLKNALFLVFDTETTGDTPGKDVPVEVAFVLTSLTHVLAQGSSLVNPGPVPMDNRARAVHHIDPAWLTSAPGLSEALRGFANELSAHTIAGYAAHFAEFDSAMLPMLNKQPWLCTYLLAKKLYPTLPSHKNQYLRYELELDVPEAEGQPTHRALADAQVTAALLRHLLHNLLIHPAMPHTLQGVLELLGQPNLLVTCTFGKHRGKTWEEIAHTDFSYLEWLVKPKPDQKPLEGDLKYTVHYWMDHAFQKKK